MSFELYTDASKCLGQLATNKGLDDLTAYVDKTKYKVLKAFLDIGQTEDLEGLKKDVSAAVMSDEAPSTVAVTLKGLEEMLKGAKDLVYIVQ